MRWLLLPLCLLMMHCSQCSSGVVSSLPPGLEGSANATQQGCLYQGSAASFEGHTTVFCAAHANLNLTLKFQQGSQLRVELNEGERALGRTTVSVTSLPPRINVVACRNEEYEGASPYICDGDSLLLIDSFGELISDSIPEDPDGRREQYLMNMRGDATIDTSPPEVIEEDVVIYPFESLDSVERVDRARFAMRNSIFSQVVLIHPESPNGDLVVYHQGHGGSPLLGIDLIEALLDDNYTVAAMAMPLRGPNEVPELGRFHYRIFDLESDDWRAMDYFISPVTRAITWGLEQADLNGDVFMTGISGGGWTTFHAAAIDTRIRKSAPVAGGVPLFSRRLPIDDWGDEEQTNLNVYSAFNYLELYALGALNDRATLYIQNEHDTCCFSGHDSELWIRDLQELLGDDGDFELFVDDTHRAHAISPEARERILEFFAAP